MLILLFPKPLRSLLEFLKEVYLVLYSSLFALMISPILFLPFADDLKLVFSFPHKSIPSPAPLQSSLDALYEWCLTWQMSVNPNKSHIFHLGNNNPKIVYMFDNCPISPIENVKDLGVIISRNLCFHRHIVDIVKKASKRTNFLFIAVKTINPDVLVHAYKCYVRSILEYCSTVYSPDTLKDRKLLEKVQYNFIRRLHYRCKTPYTSYSDSCIIFKIDPLDHRRNISTFKFIHSLFSLSIQPFPLLSCFDSWPLVLEVLLVKCILCTVLLIMYLRISSPVDHMLYVIHCLVIPSHYRLNCFSNESLLPYLSHIFSNQHPYSPLIFFSYFDYPFLPVLFTLTLPSRLVCSRIC